MTRDELFARRVLNCLIASLDDLECHYDKERVIIHHSKKAMSDIANRMPIKESNYKRNNFIDPSHGIKPIRYVALLIFLVDKYKPVFWDGCPFEINLIYGIVASINFTKKLFEPKYLDRFFSQRYILQTIKNELLTSGGDINGFVRTLDIMTDRKIIDQLKPIDPIESKS